MYIVLMFCCYFKISIFPLFKQELLGPQELGGHGSAKHVAGPAVPGVSDAPRGSQYSQLHLLLCPRGPQVRHHLRHAVCNGEI